MAENNHVDPVYSYIDNKIKSLKGQITRLSNRIEKLELSAFQDQISNLDNEIRSIDEKLLAVSRVVTFNELDALNLHMHEAIHLKLTADDPDRIQLKEYISVEYARAVERHKNSLEPLTVLKAFRKECITCSNKYKLGAFATKPY